MNSFAANSSTRSSKRKIFAPWLRPLYRQDWVVYLKRPFGGPEYVLRYLSRYTNRVAISNHRLVSFTDGQVTFRWRDSAHHNKHEFLLLPVDEILTRFLLHLLPQGFVRIRHFGFLASRRRAKLLRFAFSCCVRDNHRLTKNTLPPPNTPATFTPATKCGGPMKIIERLTAAQIQLRSPPEVTATA